MENTSERKNFFWVHTFITTTMQSYALLMSETALIFTFVTLKVAPHTHIVIAQESRSNSSSFPVPLTPTLSLNLWDTQINIISLDARQQREKSACHTHRESLAKIHHKMIIEKYVCATLHTEAAASFRDVLLPCHSLLNRLQPKTGNKCQSFFVNPRDIIRRL
jgi:hypothetical protein